MNYIQTCYTSTNAGEWVSEDIWVQDLLYPWYESTRGTTQFDTAYNQGIQEGWILTSNPIGG
jgi:hypothetical protein